MTSSDSFASCGFLTAKEIFAVGPSGCSEIEAECYLEEPLQSFADCLTWIDSAVGLGYAELVCQLESDAARVAEGMPHSGLHEDL